MELLKQYFELQKKIYDYFGYVEDWVVIPLDDATEYYWFMPDKNSVRFHEDKDNLFDEDKMDYYENIVYTQRFLPKWIYETEDYTMICVDTQVDGNKFLQVFDNKKRIK
jgi:hypothetical protein